ncbi:MAG: transglutaminaseTgpA domain-containing protein, partial [Chroococcales cyanobacterium]
MEVRRLPIFRQYWQRLEAIPLPKTEESILLRVLVQLLVAVGIGAMDVAAQTQMSLWAIPLSFVGAIWSWYRRRDRNITAKFLIAIGMILALIYFFENLFVSLNDTRLVLAELLIQLQVLHSFDLPRRKDLGYSMAIGLILLGVAGTVSQTLAFALFLLLFLAIALPILVLDYRSRLGLEPEEFALLPRQVTKRRAKTNSTLNRYSPLSAKRLGVFFLIILALGLTIFAVMPRVPGYQLRTFPVSAPEQFQNERFNAENRGIANPGYMEPGDEESGVGGSGSSTSQGKGSVDNTYYYGFNTQMNQNLRGTMESKVVLRIRSQAPGFWRVLAFDRYTGQGWEVSRDQETTDIQRRSWSYRFWIPFPDAVSVPTKEIIQSYTAVEDLPNLIPALSYPRFLYFPTPEIALGPEGEMRSPLGLIQGLTYTVISEVPYRDRTQLRNAPKKYLPEIANHYLQVPPEIEDAVRKQTEELLARSPQPLTDNYEKALYLAQAIKQNYRLQPDLPFLEDNEDLVNAFLFKYEGGYPDHFATVYTIMLRSIGIPARLAVGFSSGQFNPFTGYYIVRNTDAHALTEVYFGRYGWFSFDPIPGHEIVPLSFEESHTFSVLQQVWHWIAQWIPTPVT